MIDQIHVGIGTYIGDGVTIFPVWPEGRTVEGHCWKQAHLTVTEVPQGARVNTLQVTNNGHRPHIVVEGDIFEGGWQNRTASRTMIIPVGVTVQVPVLCVEQGRWNGTALHGMGTKVRRSPFGVRRRMFDAQAEGNGREQSEVWDEIQNLQSCRGMEPGLSLAASMDNFLEAIEAEARNVRVTALPGQRGVLVGIGGHIAGCEIFGSERALAQRLEAIVEAARYEALDVAPVATPNFRARNFARAITATQLRQTGPVPVRIDTPVGDITVSATFHDDSLVHATVLRAEPVGAF
jgi:hypothetical protein